MPLTGSLEIAARSSWPSPAASTAGKAGSCRLQIRGLARGRFAADPAHEDRAHGPSDPVRPLLRAGEGPDATVAVVQAPPSQRATWHGPSGCGQSQSLPQAVPTSMGGDASAGDWPPSVSAVDGPSPSERRAPPSEPPPVVVPSPRGAASGMPASPLPSPCVSPLACSGSVGISGMQPPRPGPATQATQTIPKVKVVGVVGELAWAPPVGSARSQREGTSILGSRDVDAVFRFIPATAPAPADIAARQDSVRVRGGASARQEPGAALVRLARSARTPGLPGSRRRPRATAPGTPRRRSCRGRRPGSRCRPCSRRSRCPRCRGAGRRRCRRPPRRCPRRRGCRTRTRW